MAYFFDRVFFLIVQFICQCCLFSIKRLRSAAFAASGPRCFETGLCPFPNQSSFKFREGSENVEDKAAAAGGSINGLLQAFKTNALFLQQSDGFDQVPQRAAKTIQGKNPSRADSGRLRESSQLPRPGPGIGSPASPSTLWPR